MAGTTLLRPVSLMEANQQFSRLVRQVETGARFVITRRGHPVAHLVPAAVDRTADREWVAACERMEALLDEGLPLRGTRMEDRDEVHERRQPDAR